VAGFWEEGRGLGAVVRACLILDTGAMVENPLTRSRYHKAVAQGGP